MISYLVIFSIIILITCRHGIFSNKNLKEDLTPTFFDNESLGQFLISIKFTKTVYPSDAFIARPEAWSIESANILLVKHETCFRQLPFGRLFNNLPRLTFLYLAERKKIQESI